MKDYSLRSVFKVLHNWRKPIIYGTAGVAVVSVIISLVLPVYYEARTIFYAASEDMFKPQKIFGHTLNEIYYFGGTNDIQRILTVAKSSAVTGFLIDSFGLYTHYNIDSLGEKAEFKIREELLDHYSIIRTKYDALELTVEDKDPRMAARMANAARDRLNHLISRMIKDSQQQLMTSYRRSIQERERALNQIYDTLRYFQVEYGIFDPEAQTEFLSTLITQIETSLARDRARLDSYEKSSFAKRRDSISYLRSTIAGHEQQLRLLKSPDTIDASNYSIERFSAAKGKIAVLDDAYEKATNAVNRDKELLKEMQAAYDLRVPALHIVQVAEVPIVKSRPNRTLLVLASTFAAFLFLVIGVLFIESYRDQDWSFLMKW